MNNSLNTQEEVVLIDVSKSYKIFVCVFVIGLFFYTYCMWNEYAIFNCANLLMATISAVVLPLVGRNEKTELSANGIKKYTYFGVKVYSWTSVEGCRKDDDKINISVNTAEEEVCICSKMNAMSADEVQALVEKYLERLKKNI